MDRAQPQPPGAPQHEEEAEGEVSPRPQTVTVAGEPTTDPQALVDRMIAAGRWPAPELLEQIVSAGEAALEPLLAILRSRPRRGPRLGPLDNAIGVLGLLGKAAAIPELVEVVGFYRNELSHRAAHSIARLGPPGFEALLELCRDPSITGILRKQVVCGARCAAGADPILRARLADVLHPILERLICKARDERDRAMDSDDKATGKEIPDDREFDQRGEQTRERADEEDVPDESSDDSESELDDLFDDDELEPPNAILDDEEFEEMLAAEHYVPTPAEEISYVIHDLTALADPRARDLINTALAENLHDPAIIDAYDVEEGYAQGGEAVSEHTDWLGMYREEYRAHEDWVHRPRVLPERTFRPQRYQNEEYAEPTSISAVAPIRNTGPKLGRNDPCWCGSGKKYKKCHWGKDRPG